jgi:predicted metal-dependent phosphoesterase TrpH
MELKGYFLYGSDKEMMMVIRGYDEDTMFAIINKLKRSREENIKELAETLESHFYDRNNDGRNSSETRSKDKKTRRSSPQG